MSVEKGARAGAWSALDIILRQGVQFIVSVILARLLSPDDFGLIALLGFFTSLSIVFVQGGLSTALVQRIDSSHEEENAVFWTNLIASAVFALLLVAIAPYVARFYGHALLRPLMFVAAAQVVLSALGAVQTAVLNRTLRFDQLTKAGIFASVVSAIASVWAAATGWGIWALAVQLLSMAASSAAALWWLCDWRPSRSVRFGSIRHLASFGAHLSLSSSLEVLYANGFSLIISKAYGVADLGIFNRANSVTIFPTNVISQIIARTALPLFSSRADDPDAMRRGFRLSIRLAMLLSLPLMVGLSLLADLVISTVFGPKWTASADVLRILALSGALLPLHVLNLQLLLAQGGSRAYLNLEIQKKIFGVICFGIGCFFGIMGVAYAAIVFGVVAYIINARPTAKSLDYGVGKQLKDLGDVFAATLFMAAGVYLLRTIIHVSPVATLGILVSSGGILYFAFGLILRLPSFTDALNTAMVVLRRSTRA